MSLLDFVVAWWHWLNSPAPVWLVLVVALVLTTGHTRLRDLIAEKRWPRVRIED